MPRRCTAPAARPSTSRCAPTGREAYEYLPTDDGHWQRAFDAQRLLAHTGRHREVGAGLLTAVLAAEHGVTIVHNEGDFEIAAEVLDFEHRWVLPRGTA